MLLKSKLSIAGLALMSASAMASTTTTVDFLDSSNIVKSNNGYEFVYTLDDNSTITVSGWADTSETVTTITGDDTITKAEVDLYTGGWGIENRDPDKHTVDNFKNNGDSGSRDYDVFLLEFEEEVNLSKATYGFTVNDVSDTQVSVAALNTNNLLGDTWSNIEANKTIESGWSQITSGYYTDFATDGTSNVSNESSKYWLIGALNTVFGGIANDVGDDGFKLSGITFSTEGTNPGSVTVTVPEPTSIMMFGLALVGFAASRRKAK